jgi:hypothetical protein
LKIKSKEFKIDEKQKVKQNLNISEIHDSKKIKVKVESKPKVDYSDSNLTTDFYIEYFKILNSIN